MLPPSFSSCRMNTFGRCKLSKLKRLIVKYYSEWKPRSPRFLTQENMNQNIKLIEYAVRGPLLLRATEIENELAAGVQKPFKKVLKANLGDSQAMGQKPITFFRQVLALVTYPELLKNSHFPLDTVIRAKEFLSACRGGSVGAYSESFGIELVRKNVAKFISERDGFPSQWTDILLCGGASDAIKSVIKLINQEVSRKPPGILVPIPQYPLYSATLSEFGIHYIGYYLKEKTGWGLDIDELDRTLEESKRHCVPRAIVIINPGNPTGQVLTRENIEEIIRFAYCHKLLLLADEVYQQNIYSENSKFHSFKKVINELGKPFSDMELASFMSCSKGYMGECGIRGGYCELVNFDPEVRVHFAKCISAMLCPTVLGQCLLNCIVKPPVRGDPSYELYNNEKEKILKGLAANAKTVYNFYNSVKGYSCNEVQGAMYAFPKINIPEKAIDEAKSKNMPADTLYAFQLLENTGICVVPGSGFKQEQGTYHYRTTILLPSNQLNEMLQSLRKFHENFMEKYS